MSTFNPPRPHPTGGNAIEGFSIEKENITIRLSKFARVFTKVDRVGDAYTAVVKGEQYDEIAEQLLALK